MKNESTDNSDNVSKGSRKTKSIVDYYDVEESESIPFTLDHMMLLLSAYDGFHDLQEGLVDLLEMDHNAGDFHNLSKIDTLICDLSPLYKRGEENKVQEFRRILLDGGEWMGLKERALRLMGLPHFSRKS